MMPKTHIILGAIFSILLLFIFPEISIYGAILIFLSSFLIDFDHYIIAVMRKKSLNLKKSYNYHIIQGKKILAAKKKNKIVRGDFFLFHTVEFLAVVYLLSFIWHPFIYILIGMIFHIFLDIIYLVRHNMMYAKEFSLINWIIRTYAKK